MLSRRSIFSLRTWRSLEILASACAVVRRDDDDDDDMVDILGSILYCISLMFIERADKIIKLVGFNYYYYYYYYYYSLWSLQCCVVPFFTV